MFKPPVAVVSPSGDSAGDNEVIVENVVERAGEVDPALDALIGNCFLETSNESIAALFSVLETGKHRSN